ncbi:unconventional myosin-IXa isoform X2 [Tribolium castaneum]|uniref:unconventional myosin-IXa isoform X2 n=1 Tax=Tribolium castaneum TaxID=7070 RepID=UPI0030FE0D80
MSTTENNRYIVQVYVGALSALYEALSVEASKQTTSEEIVSCIVERLLLNENVTYELAEVIGDDFGEDCKERRLAPSENPVQVMMLWPKNRTDQSSYRFYLREKISDFGWQDQFVMDPQLIKDYFHRFLYQPKDREYPDLCQLPDLNEQTLLDNLRARFVAGHIYTYVGSILIALNPFKFYPIYNPKYVKLYQNRKLGPNLPPHIFAVADTAYYCMLKDRKNQCIVISGESGSGKTESTNFLLHHLTALSQKGSHGSGVEQTILSAGPVLEAFGNAKTAHNNNSSRFGKFIQVNYKENGMVHGAVVQKYLLEKSRICSQGRNERNYHVFYYLLEGATEQEKQILHLKTPDQYYYLNKSCHSLENVDESYEFSRLKQSMEMVGFTAEKQRRLFSVLSAVLLLGNVEFQPRRPAYHHDESVGVKNPEVVFLISELLRVKQETLLQALTAKKARASGETLVITYKLPEAIASRDAMAKCLYGALFDWIVLQVNHALLSKKDTLREHQGNSIGVLDIFGFEDFGLNNSFEQLCINYANEHLQYYFNQHVFKYEQEEYRKEGIRWNNIDFMDNTGCLQLIEGKPNGLLCLLDDQCNFPGATNETLLQKFNTVHKDNKFYNKPQKKEGAFIVVHYAGKVKYQVTDMREKNLDLMRQDIVGVLKNSSMAFVRELVGADPVAVFRWAIVRAFFRAYFAFHEAGRKHRQGRVDGNKNNIQQRYQRNHTPNENIISHLVTVSAVNLTVNRIAKNKSFRPRERSKKGLKNLQSVKTLAGRTGITATNQGQLGKARKQPMTVTAQFQQSLHSLMDTLNQANPFFIRCIKSNSNKIPNQFDDETVQRQLRYTGMLETVRIRQAGFNVRLTYDEFIQLYRILLPKGLLSSQNDVRHFLATLNLDRDNYQLGGSKVFLRESEKHKLDCKLHQQIMASIITLQRWFRVCLERRRFLRIKSAVITIQSYCRMFLVQKNIKKLNAVLKIQKAWRGYKCRSDWLKIRGKIVTFQAHCRGFLLRKKLLAVKPSHYENLFNSNDLSRIKDLDSDESGDGELDAHHSRLSLRSTLSLPAHTSPTYFLYNQNNRLENTKKEGVILDESKRKISKTHKTIDYSELDYDPQSHHHRKNSDDSLTSPRQSTESLLSRQKGGPKQWSTQSTDSETFCTHSAPPTVGSFSSEEVFKNEETTKRQLTRAPPVSATGLKSLPPVRRTNRDIIRTSDDKTDVYYGNDHTPNKLEQILGKPEVPSRSVRKTKRGHVKSLGEEVTDSGSLDKSAILGTIEETKTLHKDDLIKPSLTPKRQRHNIALDLRRRNSDPATKASVSDLPTDDFKWQKNSFSIAGHTFRKIHRLQKDDLCAFCGEKVDVFLTHVYKCSNCKKLFHTKCIQNRSVCKMPCDQSCTSSRRKQRKHSRTPYDFGRFNLTGTSEFTDRSDQIITGTEELTLMQQFITDKIMKIESEVGEKPSEVDRVFKQALREFKDNLVQIYSAATKHGFDAGCIRYKDLIMNFMQAMQTVCQREQKENDVDFPVTMGVNAFRGFMNEFMSTRAEEKPNKTKRKKEKKRKLETYKHKGHTFLLTIINIPTACEICNSFFMWPIERGLVCQSCKLTCHKKCYTNATNCNKEEGSECRVFGVPLVSLITENSKVPLVIERLLRTIEMRGSYTEGIYRKSGVSSKIKELKSKMDENPDEVDFEKYQVHVLASVLKCFLREMPEPLLTFECYENFITAANLEDPQDRVATLYDILKKLPPANYDLMERLVFHLARVALHEEVNRMSAASLAIVFAPCVLRTNKVVPAQDSLQDISSQTQCIETIIKEQLRKVRATLDDIDTLDTACQAATNRLSSLRSSKVFSPEELMPSNQPQQQNNDEEHLLVDHIQEIQKEKEHLTSTLPTLTHAMSDDDMLSTDGDGSLDDISCIGDDNNKVRLPVVRSISSGDGTFPVKLKRQLSSDVKVMEDCEDPIMV